MIIFQLIFQHRTHVIDLHVPYRKTVVLAFVFKPSAIPSPRRRKSENNNRLIENITRLGSVINRGRFKNRVCSPRPSTLGRRSSRENYPSKGVKWDFMMGTNARQALEGQAEQMQAAGVRKFILTANNREKNIYRRVQMPKNEMCIKKINKRSSEYQTNGQKEGSPPGSTILYWGVFTNFKPALRVWQPQKCREPLVQPFVDCSGHTPT